MDVYDSMTRRFASAVTRLTAGALAVVLLAAVPACAQETGDEGDEAAQQQDQAQQIQQLRQLQQELQQIQTQLDSVQRQAMQDTSVQRMLTDMQETLFAAMQEADPQTEQRQNRLNELRGELLTAQQQQDTASQRELITEARQLQQEIQQTQQQVMQRDSIAQMVQAMQDSLVVVMNEIDPEVEQLMARQDSLVRQLQQLQSQMQRGTGQAPDTAGGQGGGG